MGSPENSRMGSCLPPCGPWAQPPPMAPGFQPKLVALEFKEFAEGRDTMTVQDLTKYIRDKQGDNVTEEEVRRRMEQFIDALMRSHMSSRHLRRLGLSNRGSRSFSFGGGSRSAKQGLLASDRPEREPPTFTLPLFLKFLLNPIYNGHLIPSLNPPSKDMVGCIFTSFL